MANESYNVKVTLTDGSEIDAGDVVIPVSNVIGVKGNEETTFRKGQVNLTPENIGAAKATELTAEISRATSTEQSLQSQIDEFSAGNISSVNGQTGAVSLTANDVGALPLSGGTLTGVLNINGVGDGNWSLRAIGDVQGDRIYEGETRVYSPNNPNIDLVQLTYSNSGTYTLPSMDTGQILFACISIAKNVYLKYSDNSNQKFSIVFFNNNNVSWEFDNAGNEVFLSNTLYTTVGSFCIIKRTQ